MKVFIFSCPESPGYRLCGVSGAMVGKSPGTLGAMTGQGESRSLLQCLPTNARAVRVIRHKEQGGISRALPGGKVFRVSA